VFARMLRVCVDKAGMNVGSKCSSSAPQLRFRRRSRGERCSRNDIGDFSQLEEGCRPTRHEPANVKIYHAALVHQEIAKALLLLHPKALYTSSI
jgi:hypothetical protein